MEKKKKVIMKVKKFIRFFGPVAIWLGVIFLFSSLPARPVSRIYWREFAFKKTAHMVEYAILAILILRAFKNYGYKVGKIGMYVVIFGMLYGLSDEFHQSFVYGREPTLRDAGFDTIGSYIGLLLVWKYLPKAPKKLKDLARQWQLI